MKANCSKIVVCLIILVTFLPLSGLVKADIYEISAGTIHISYWNNLDVGDKIIWDWHTTDMSEGLDFWVEDSSGARYSYRTNLQSYSDSYTVPSSGYWSVNWENDNLVFSVTVEYDVIVERFIPDNGGDGSVTPSFDWMLILGIIIIVVVIVAVIAAVVSAGKKKQPPYQQPPQQQYQQPPPPQPPQYPPGN